MFERMLLFILYCQFFFVPLPRICAHWKVTGYMLRIRIRKLNYK